MDIKKIIVGLLVSAVLASGIGVAVASDASNPYSNFVDWVIASDTSFTVSVGGGATKVVFSPASKTETNVEPTGQSSGTPIFTVTNTGNTDLNFSCNLTVAKPAWAIIKVNDEYVNNTADEFDTTAQVFNTTVISGGASPMYLWTNVTNAVAGTANRTIHINSVAS